ncbi:MULTISPECIES: glycosyltransferase family 2 protein [unclassified Lonepinella]|uniref:glycosyltransferase family 2 protein n=1 Tax=unclassified Lonepinella TaxID=2642006 RepID=UPI0036D8BEAB
MQKLLTIVVPTYNTEQYLPRCLDSLILDESLMNKVEVLVVIDGSPDNSYAVAKKYEEKHPQTFKVVNKENGGHGSTINKGLELATGKYFKVLDSDDWFDSDVYQSFLFKLDSLDVDIVLTDYVKEYIFEGRKEVLSLSNQTKDTIIELKNIDTTHHVDNLFSMARMTYKTEVLRTSRLSLPEKTFYVDTIYAMTPLFFSHNVIYLGLELYRYFIGREEQSMTLNNQIKNRLHIKKVFIHISDKFIENDSNLSGNIKSYTINFLTQMSSFGYILPIYLSSSEGYRESKEWHIKMKAYSFLKSTKVSMLYNFLPYWAFSSLLKLREKVKSLVKY